MDPFFSPMVRTINRNLLKYSAGYYIFCPQCGQVADAKRWVIVSQGDKTKACCAPCWDKYTEGKTIPPSVEVIDGRQIFARPKSQKRATAAPSTIPTAV